MISSSIDAISKASFDKASLLFSLDSLQNSVNYQREQQRIWKSQNFWAQSFSFGARILSAIAWPDIYIYILYTYRNLLSTLHIWEIGLTIDKGG